jgi:hypothetical protein
MPETKNPSYPVVMAVITLAGHKWEVGGIVPGEPETKIVRIFQYDDGIEIFAQALGNHPAAKAGLGLHFKLYPLNLAAVASAASTDVWQEMLATATAEEATDFADDDEPPKPGPSMPGEIQAIAPPNGV